MKKILIFLAFLLILSNCFAEGMSGSGASIFTYLIEERTQPSIGYVALNVDTKSSETISARYRAWSPSYNDDECGAATLAAAPTPQPNNVLNQWPGDTVQNFWIQFVPPSEIGNEAYSLNKTLCNTSPCLQNFTASEGGAWQVRFGAGVSYAYCYPFPIKRLWQWGITNWDITVNGKGGRVWTKEWKIYAPYSANAYFYPVSLSLNSPADYCKTRTFDDPQCKGSLFEAYLSNSFGINWILVSNSKGITYTSPTGEKRNLKESIPLQRSTETCLDDFGLIPERYARSNTTVEAEHRIYWEKPEFFTQESLPQITQLPQFSPAATPPGGQFSLTTNLITYYELTLDLDKDGSFDPYSPDSEDVILKGTTNTATPKVITWGGTTKSGAVAAPGTYDVKLRVFTDEANFPLDDFESCNLRIKKFDPVAANFASIPVYWHDSIAGGSNNLTGGNSHNWHDCITSKGLPLNVSTNCFPFGFSSADCAHEYVSACCPTDKSRPRLDLTVGEVDWINTWVYGESVQQESSFTVPAVGSMPQAILNVNKNIITEGDTVTFTGGCSDPDNDLDTCIIDFGDGSAQVAFFNGMTRAYSAGVYDAVLTALDLTGRSGTNQETITVNPPAPECTEGDCCELATKSFKPTTQTCNSWTEKQCVGSGCGNFVEEHTATQYCPGDDKDCTGSIVNGSWSVVENCDPEEICDIVGFSCVPDAGCALVTTNLKIISFTLDPNSIVVDAAGKTITARVKLNNPVAAGTVVTINVKDLGGNTKFGPANMAQNSPKEFIATFSVDNSWKLGNYVATATMQDGGTVLDKTTAYLTVSAVSYAIPETSLIILPIIALFVVVATGFAAKKKQK